MADEPTRSVELSEEKERHQTPESMTDPSMSGSAWQQLARLQRELEETRDLLGRLEGSVGVRLTRRFWSAREHLMPPGSRRRQTYEELVRPLKRRLTETAPASPTTSAQPLRPHAGNVAAGPDLSLKEALTRRYDAELQAFLASGRTLDFGGGGKPRVTILLILFNRAELTFRCLRSLKEGCGLPFELIIVDNASTDQTGALLDRVLGARILRNRENLHFLRGVNQGAQHASGDHLLLLNNDAAIQPGAVDLAVETLESDRKIGAVGGRILLMDGTLQEAGSNIWSDGSCEGVGRGLPADAAPFMVQRDVDYCSGAFLLTPLETFRELGGLDDSFAPAYYEETDYCVRLWKQGRRIVFDPRVSVVHFEFASTGGEATAASAMMEERKQIFRAHHSEWLQSQPSRASVGGLRVLRRDRREAPSVLFIDDKVPLQGFGAGSPRSGWMLRALDRLGFRVTFHPMQRSQVGWSEAWRELPRTSELLMDGSAASLSAFLEERLDSFDHLIVSRPHNMERLRRVLRDLGRWPSPVPIIYDAEAVFALREAHRQKLGLGAAAAPAALAEALDAELHLADGARSVLTVSPAEQAHFQNAGHPEVHVLGHAMSPSPTPAPFDERQGLLFVGALNGEDTPNSDSLVWFLSEVLPRLDTLMGRSVPVSIVGRNPPASILSRLDAQIRWLGEVDDLAPLYNRARVFIAPTRFAAGIPYKVHHAAAHGLPIVASRLLADQVGWTHGRELLVGATPEGFAEACAQLYTSAELWASVRELAMNGITRDCAPERLEHTLRNLLGPTTEGEVPSEETPILR